MKEGAVEVDDMVEGLRGDVEYGVSLLVVVSSHRVVKSTTKVVST